ncbi:MAG: oligosaccharide flippase family protein [Planctomycetota bacterium]|nr:oligosaccharide flippase family protein [Planctomycetota bacterium]
MAGQPTGNLRASVGAGVSWMALATVIGKLATFFAQIALGWLLSKGDFGVYATAISVAGFVMLFRDGGVRELLIQRGQAQYEKLVGPVFGMAATINLATALTLAALAEPISHAFTQSPEDAQRLKPLLWIIAASLPLGTPAAILQARLRMNLQFGILSRIQMISSILRQASTVGFAIAGLGPLSFVLPLFVCALYEGIASWRATREAPWARSWAPGKWLGLFMTTIWLCFGSVSNFMLDMGDQAVISTMVPSQTVGTYYFAVMIMAQLGVLMSYNLQLVLMPALTRLKDNRDRLREALLKSLRVLMIVAAPGCLGLAVLMEPVERVLWHGKWDAAVLVVQIFGIFYPLRITFGATTALLQSQGRFRAWSLKTFLEGLCFMGGAALGAHFGARELVPGLNHAAHIALGVGLGMLISRSIVLTLSLASVGASFRQRVVCVVPAWLLAVGVAGACWAVDWALVDRAGLVAGAQSWLTDHAKLGSQLAETLVQLVRGGLLFTLYCALYIPAARLLLAQHLREALETMPARLRPRLARLVRLDVAPASTAP